MIDAPWGRLHGDVELHVRAGDFERHGHHRDAAYNDLALHLVYRHDGLRETLLASGRAVPVAALAPWLEHRRDEVRRWLERPTLWQEPCRSAVARLGEGAVAGALDRLGDIRFRRRARELRRQGSEAGAEEALYRALLEALGYGGNREAFRSLAARLAWRDLRSPLLRLRAAERAAAALQALTEAAAQPPALAWRGGGLRPANQPLRRLEAAGHLAARYAEPGLLAGLSALLELDARSAVAALTARTNGRTLLGEARAIELLTNAVLPALATFGVSEQRRSALELYRGLPRPAAYGPVRHLDDALDHDVRVDARRQQGMLFLLRNYCSRGRCGTCPLS